MKILLSRTRPPETPLERRHTPKPSRRWSDYRNCLRWDFGFVCPFCLLHDADIVRGPGAEGWGTTSVEHHKPRSRDPDKVGDYDNCLYACIRCNRARSNRPIEVAGRRLLDPTEVAWGDHFELVEGDRIEPLAGDRDAEYTAEAYQPNDPGKVERRRDRRKLIVDHLETLVELPRKTTELSAFADRLLKERRDYDGLLLVIATIQRNRRLIRKAYRDLQRYAAVPADAPESCRCRATDHHTLPKALARQTFDLPDAS